MFFEGGVFVSATAIIFDDFKFYRGMRPGQRRHQGALAQSIGFCYGFVCGVFVMDMLLRMLPHSPWLLAMDASMF